MYSSSSIRETHVILYCRVARTPKVSLLQERHASFGEKFEVVGIDDLVTGDFSGSLAGV